ncbi:putative inhibitor of apoptosis [Diabrotica undecimpunctata]|uniref:putative inhibitor of apoptosis n=1 Tax=Diabrotica undecimpunctata TaxID=50387 RepID=UPI003B639AA8
MSAKLLEYRSLSKRLTSYKNWPISHPIKPIHLSIAGFSYTGHNDKVRCKFCDTSVNKWLATDIPMKKHKATCCFRKLFRKIKKLVSYEERLNTFAKWFGDDACQHAKAGYFFNGSALRFVAMTDVSSYEVRLKTFESQDLAKEGFFYSGFKYIVHTDMCILLMSAEVRANTDKCCRICLNAELQIVFMPCRHLVTCTDCGYIVDKCAMCRCVITDRLRIFM